MRALNEEELEQRKRKVLQSVVHEFVRTGKPVGSNSIVSAGKLGLSSATIRNILGELEQDDLITHPHTSAGRIPTDKGYRSYVDSLIELQRLAVQEESRIQREYDTRMKEIEGLMSQTSKMLSSISHYTGFVMSPKLEKNIFSSIELVPVSEKRILVAMITESGLAKHFIINTGVDIPRDRLKSIARMINQSFQGCTLHEVQIRMMEKLDNAQQEYVEMIALAKEIGEEIKNFSTSSIYLDGARNILSLPDFTSTDDAQDLFKVIEEKQLLKNILENDLLKKPRSGSSGKSGKKNKKNAPTKKTDGIELETFNSGIKILIGSENTNKAMQNLSVISSTYQLSDRTVGILGVMGPKRMEYPKMIALVDYISQIMNRMLKEFENK